MSALFKMIAARARLAFGVAPLSERWGWDRGKPLHRWYVDRFLARFSADVRGRCLEFNDALYCQHYGGARVTDQQVVHIDASNALATIVADLAGPNDVPSDRFDCIVCTHVLHVVRDPPRMIAELHRILAPGGVLLIAAPQLSMAGPEFHELWRFTQNGVRHLLAPHFPEAIVESYGNSLVAAAEIRGLVVSDLTVAELLAQDDRFAIEVCARAVKR